MAFSFDGLKAEVTELPAITRDRGTGFNPFKQMLADSYADNKGRQVVIPAEAVAEAQRLIRRAADQLKIGSRIVIDNGKKDFKCTPDIVKEWAEKKSKAQITVKFQAQDRRERKARAKKETPAEIPAEVPAEVPEETPAETPAE